MKTAIVSGVAAVYLACPKCGGGMIDLNTGSFMIEDTSTEIECEVCNHRASVPKNAFPNKNGERITRLQQKAAK